jgi:hypothetical protein
MPPEPIRLDSGSVLTSELAGKLEAGMALVVGTVCADGRPYASRGWGIRVIDPGGGIVRLLVDRTDHVTLSNLERSGRIAVTGSGVRTFIAVQMKAHVAAVEPATPEDLAAAARWREGFLDAVSSTDGYSRRQLDRWAARELVAVVAQAEKLFDQTPGPTAGAHWVADAS